jgi:hypothetical protein
MVGTAGGGVPPVTTVPAPLKLSVMPLRPIDPEPDRVKAPPVTPTLAREPPVTAIEPPVKLVPETADIGSLKVPVILSVPVSVMVKEPLNPEASDVTVVVVKVPLPMVVSVAGPEIEVLVPIVTVAFVTVSVVLIVAAGAAAQTRKAKVKIAHTRVIGPFRVLHSLLNAENP